MASTEHRHFREQVRDWLRTHKPKDERPATFGEQAAYDRAWQRAQFEGGWAGIAWPGEYGGRGLSPMHQLIWLEEYAAAHCPLLLDSCWLGVNHAGPTLIARGSSEHKAFHLPRILDGRSTWCQGFSEPNAGSDLANLQVRAEIDGDCLVVNGQKTWTTFAHLADYQELLVRTGAPDSRHRGLTWVICDMHSPGVDVRPMKALFGGYHNCEVFYDDVRIPLTNVVGEIGAGWSVAMTTFEYERGSAMFGRLCETATALEDLVQYASGDADGDTRPIDDGEVRSKLGSFRAQVQSLKAVAHLMAIATADKRPLGAEGLILNLPFAELAQAIYRFAMRLLGMRGLSRSVAGNWIHGYFEAFSHTIAGGTSEIQRNVIAERLLGLPR